MREKMIQELNKLVKVTYKREEDMIHDITGIIRNVRKKSLRIEDECGNRISIGFKNIRGFKVLQLLDEEMKARIVSLVGKIVFIEYQSDFSLIRTIGRIIGTYEHHFDFESNYEKDKLYRIHFDHVIQLQEPNNQESIKVNLNPNGEHE
jgi:hypothetical protein